MEDGFAARYRAEQQRILGRMRESGRSPERIAATIFTKYCGRDAATTVEFLSVVPEFDPPTIAQALSTASGLNLSPADVAKALFRAGHSGGVIADALFVGLALDTHAEAVDALCVAIQEIHAEEAVKSSSTKENADEWFVAEEDFRAFRVIDAKGAGELLAAIASGHHPDPEAAAEAFLNGEGCQCVELPRTLGCPDLVAMGGEVTPLSGEPTSRRISW